MDEQLAALENRAVLGRFVLEGHIVDPLYFLGFKTRPATNHGRSLRCHDHSLLGDLREISSRRCRFEGVRRQPDPGAAKRPGPGHGGGERPGTPLRGTRPWEYAGAPKVPE